MSDFSTFAEKLKAAVQSPPAPAPPEVIEEVQRDPEPVDAPITRDRSMLEK